MKQSPTVPLVTLPDDEFRGELMVFLKERCMPFTGFSGEMLGVALVIGCFVAYVGWYYYQRHVFRGASKAYGDGRKQANSTRTGIEVAIAIAPHDMSSLGGSIEESGLRAKVMAKKPKLPEAMLRAKKDREERKRRKDDLLKDRAASRTMGPTDPQPSVQIGGTSLPSGELPSCSIDEDDSVLEPEISIASEGVEMVSPNALRERYLIPHHPPTLPGDGRTQRVFFFDLFKISAGMSAAVLINMLVIAQLLLVSLERSNGDRKQMAVGVGGSDVDQGDDLVSSALLSGNASAPLDDGSILIPPLSTRPARVGGSKRRERQLKALQEEVFLPMAASFDGMSWWSAIFISDVIIGVPLAILCFKLVGGIAALILRLIKERRYAAVLLGLDEDRPPAVDLYATGYDSSMRENYGGGGRKYWHAHCIGLPIQRMCQMIAVSGRYNFEEDLEPYNPKAAIYWATLQREHQEERRARRLVVGTTLASEEGGGPRQNPVGPGQGSSPKQRTLSWWDPRGYTRPLMRVFYSEEERKTLADPTRMAATYDADLWVASPGARRPDESGRTSFAGRARSFGTLPEGIGLLSEEGGRPRTAYGATAVSGGGRHIGTVLTPIDAPEEVLPSGFHDAETLARMAEEAHANKSVSCVTVVAAGLVPPFVDGPSGRNSFAGGRVRSPSFAEMDVREFPLSSTSPQGGPSPTTPMLVEDVEARRIPRLSWLFAQTLAWVFCIVVSRFVVVGITFWTIGLYKDRCTTISDAVDAYYMCYAHQEAYTLFEHTAVEYGDVRAVLIAQLEEERVRSLAKGGAVKGGSAFALTPDAVMKAYETAVWNAHVARAEQNGEDLLVVYSSGATVSEMDEERSEAMLTTPPPSSGVDVGGRGKKERADRKSVKKRSNLPSIHQQQQSRAHLRDDQLAAPGLALSFALRSPILSIGFIFQQLADTMSCDRRQWVLGGGMRIVADLFSLALVDAFNRFSS